MLASHFDVTAKKIGQERSLCRGAVNKHKIEPPRKMKKKTKESFWSRRARRVR
jgi:hypothetical protein